MHKKIKGLLLALWLLLSFVSPKTVLAGSVSVSAQLTDDTSVKKSLPNQSFGSVRQLPLLYGANNNAVIYLKFTLPQIPSNATIDSAYLGLVEQMVDLPINEGIVYVGQVKDNWNEETLNWQNKPGAVRSTPSSNVGETNKYLYHNVTWIVERWKQGQPNYGFVVFGPPTDSWYYEYYSKEGNQAYAPKLVINYTTQDGQTQTTTNPQSIGITNTTTPSAKTTKTFLKMTTTVAPPGFHMVFGGGQEIGVEKGKADISFGKLITIVGTGKAGQQILMWANGQAYETTVNSKGYWGVTVDSQSWAQGEYLITAQAISNGKGSQNVPLVTLSKTDLTNVVNDLSGESQGMNKLDKFFAGMFYIEPILKLGFWLFVILMIMIFVRHHNKKKTKIPKSADTPKK